MESPSNESKWLVAHNDPFANLKALSSCLALADLNGDGEFKLVIADLGRDGGNRKLKVYKGTNLNSENTLIDVPTALVAFHMDTTEPRVPAVAVASGSFIYIYKNLRPYFKFTLPTLDVNSMEFDAWSQARDDVLDVSMLYEILDSIRQEQGESSLTTRSQRFLMCTDSAEQTAFVEAHKGFMLKKQTVVTCMETLKKNHETEKEAISCLVLGTESANIYILDPEAFIILDHMTLPSIPVFLTVSGLYDVEFRVVVSCRNGFVYTLKRGSKVGRETFELSSQPIGLLRKGKSIVVATMDEIMFGYSNKGKRLWSVQLPSSATCMESIFLSSQALELIAVALQNRKVLIYYDRLLVDTITTEDVVVAMRFGPYGREKEALILLFQEGGLHVLLLRRTAKFDLNPKNSNAAAATQKLSIPKKTKLFVDQTMRERENAVLMHRVFQHDLYRLRLNTARAYVHALETSSNPVSLTVKEPLKLSAQVQGLGPTFKLKVELQNTSSSNPSFNLAVLFHWDDQIYDVKDSYIEIPMLVPNVLYAVDTLLTCVSEFGVSDVIRVFVIRKGMEKPILSALVNMPVAEIEAD